MTRWHCAVLAGLVVLQPHARSEPRPAEDVPVKLSEFVVTPSRFGVADEATTAGASLTSTELETLPQIGDDLFRSIARLPGLAASDFTAKFWVRGAPQSELLARFDGVDLVEPFHLKDVDGALSIVDPQTVSRLDLVTGGFTTEYGDCLAAVLNLETKRAARPGTALGLSLTGISGMNQGTFASGRGGWLVDARRGYPDVALRVAHRADEVDPRYYDATAKVEYTPVPGQTVSFHLLHAGDTLRNHHGSDPSLRSGYDSDYAWVRWEGRVGERVTGEAVLSYTRLTWSRDGAGSLDGYPFTLRDHRRLESIGLRNDWTAGLTEWLLLRGGVEAKSAGAWYDYALRHQFSVVEGGRQVVATDQTTAALHPDAATLGGFASLRTRLRPGLVIEPGMRIDHWGTSAETAVSPRLNAAWTVGRTVVRGAWGQYVQAQGVQELDFADGDTRFHRAERAEQRVLGIERGLARGVSARIELYERTTTRVRPQWVNLDNPYDLFPEARSDRALLAPDRARARGVEVWLSGRGVRRVSWNISYALARTEERLAGRWVPRSTDQRHAFYADVTYAPGATWSFSAAWQFHSGWPTTDESDALATLTNGRRVIVATNGPAYGLRMPDYHRLDLRATRRFAVRRGDLRVFLDIFNAYDRRNVIGYDHGLTVSGTQVTDRKRPREQLPFLPSAGATWEF